LSDPATAAIAEIIQSEYVGLCYHLIPRFKDQDQPVMEHRSR
jgi:hypothetical protein